MIGALTGSLVEAWQELRIHKLRVLLSLVGVAVAVSSLTLVVAMSTVVQERIQTSYEQMSGRDATLVLSAGEPGVVRDAAALHRAVDPVLEDFEVTYASAGQDSMTLVQSSTGTQYATATLVEQDWRSIFSVQVVEGRWFSPGEEENLAPSAVVNENVLEWSGHTAADLPYSMEARGSEGADPVTLTVVGVTPGNDYDEGQVFVLAGAPAAAQVLSDEMFLSVFAWVPSDIAAPLAEQLGSRLTQDTGEAWDVYRSDMFEWDEDPLGPLKAVLLGIAGLILFLGVLGLVNIALVTVQQRVREIGIRRSFGATGARVFFSVLMESVVATSIAGVVGIALSVLLLRSPLLTSLVGLGENMAAPPAFPMSAALVGFAVAVAAGAVAGFVPALIATRAKIVDAIRA